ncbi:MAG: hypothetical protein Q3992_03930 [Bacteroides sp.]|nr:hypothetical protein [Bacteroides sp.]
MSLTANIYPRTIALSDNPIKLEISSSSLVTYKIKEGDDILYTGSVEKGVSSTYINEIVSSIVSPTLLPVTGSDELIFPVSNNLKEYTVELSNTEGENTVVNHKVLLGGISKRAMRDLHSVGKNIFTSKLLNNTANFLMTTRTEEKYVTIKETELYPLLFIAPSDTILLRSKSHSGVSVEINNLTEGNLYALHIDNVRKIFFSEHNTLCNSFQLHSSAGHAADIIITPAEIEKERYCLQFLNSYGSYERIEVCGHPTKEQESKEEDTYNEYDEVVNDYVEMRNRVKRKESIKVSTGVKTAEELLFLYDMICSTEIYLIGYEDRHIRVNVSADNAAVSKSLGEPTSIELALRFIDTETHFTHELPDEIGSARIHDDKFNYTFN